MTPFYFFIIDILTFAFLFLNLRPKGDIVCLAIPGKVKKIEDNQAFFDYDDKEYRADTSLAPDISVGDWILMHDGRALSKITEAEAKENLEFIRTHKEMESCL